MSSNFSQYYEQYFDDIYRYVYCKTGSTWDTDDIVSQVFIKAYRNFDRPQANSKAWLVTIARNTTMDFFRRAGREIPADTAGIPVSAVEDLEHELEKTCLKAALGRLDADDFELINLRFFCGLKFKEMAAVLGVRQGAVKMRVYRALEGMRKKVEQCLAGENS